MSLFLKRFSILILLSLGFFCIDGYPSKESKVVVDSEESSLSACEQLYAEMNLEGVIDYDVFEKAYKGYKSFEVKKENILSIIDFSLPSSEKRLFILDMLNKKILYESYVSHGKNSGGLYATSFSNKHGSNKSSLGFFTTENTYIGSNGYSLILNGLEKGLNDQAKARAIVMHGANYCSQAVIKSSGRLGRSLGCPSIPLELTKPIINTIKDGSLLYIYASE